jgi:hypothetical protein
MVKMFMNMTRGVLIGLLSKIIEIVGTGAEWEGSMESQHTPSKSTSGGLRRRKKNKQRKKFFRNLKEEIKVAWASKKAEIDAELELEKQKKNSVSFTLDGNDVLTDEEVELNNREFAEIGYRQVIAIITAHETEDVDLIGVSMADTMADHDSAFAGLVVACGSLISLSKTLKENVNENLDLRNLLMEMQSDNLKEIHIAKAVNSVYPPNKPKE